MLRKIFIPLAIILLGLFQVRLAIGLTLNSTAFLPGQAIPAIYTCEGRDKVPDLSWADIPQSTQSFALIMEDPDAVSGVWVHWVVFNIPATVHQWQPDNLDIPVGVMAGKNSWGRDSYSGPCPPSGRDHHYIFTLYALNRLIDLPAGANAQQIREAAKNHILGQATLMGTYRRSH